MANQGEAALPNGAAAQTLLNGAYRIERVIGEGAFGRVYLATDTRLNSPVAIKELRADRSTVPESVYLQYLERFQREARAARLSQHPNIVAVYALDVDSAHNNYLVMEFVDGTDLRDLLTQVGTLPIERAVAIATEVAKALDAVHEQDIVHRDLKPANIILTRRGMAKLADFGVAQVGHESLRTQIDASHPGTPMYMSPEQASQTEYLDGRSDLYALGLVLYEVLAGELYMRQKRPLAEARPDTPPALVAIVEKLIEPDRDRRYQSAAAVVVDLQRFSTLPPSLPVASAQTGTTAPSATVLASSHSVQSAPPAAPRPARLLGTRRGLLALIGIIVVVVLAGGIVLFALQSGGAALAATATPAALAATTLPNVITLIASPSAVGGLPTATVRQGNTTGATPTRTPASTDQTMTWTDPNGRLSLQYPGGWNPGRTTSPNQLATFEGPNGVRFTVILYATGTMTADQAVHNLLAAQQSPAYQSITFSHDPVMDGTIAGEPAKVLNQSFVSKNNTVATPTAETLSFVKHGTIVWEFIATNPGVHKPEIEAVLASVMWL